MNGSDRRADPDEDWDRPPRVRGPGLLASLFGLLVQVIGLCGRLAWMAIRVVAVVALCVGAVVAGFHRAARHRK